MAQITIVPRVITGLSPYGPAEENETCEDTRLQGYKPRWSDGTPISETALLFGFGRSFEVNQIRMVVLFYT